MTEEEKDRVGKILTGRGAIRPCARCGNQLFSVEGYFNLPVVADLKQIGTLFVGGISIPTVAAVCNKCGAFTHHALGTLGLLPPPEPK